MKDLPEMSNKTASDLLSSIATRGASLWLVELAAAVLSYMKAMSKDDIPGAYGLALVAPWDADDLYEMYNATSLSMFYMHIDDDGGEPKEMCSHNARDGMPQYIGDANPDWRFALLMHAARSTTPSLKVNFCHRCFLPEGV